MSDCDEETYYEYDSDEDKKIQTFEQLIDYKILELINKYKSIWGEHFTDDIICIILLITKFSFDDCDKIIFINNNLLKENKNFNLYKKTTCECCLLDNADIYYPQYSVCNHNICLLCYRQEITKIIKSMYPNNCIIQDCPTCKKMIYSRQDLYNIFSNLERSEINAQIQKIIINTYINSNSSLFMYCINEECKELLYNNYNKDIITCTKCNLQLCFKCKQEFHYPADCDEYKTWKISIDQYNEDESLKWISLNCKKCPNPYISCGAQIIKMPSCLKMICSKCGYIFCWNCLQDYSTHYDSLSHTGFYKCPNKAYETNSLNSDLVKIYFLYENYYKLYFTNYKDTYIKEFVSITYIIKVLLNFVILLNYNSDKDYIKYFSIKIYNSLNLILLDDYFKDDSTDHEYKNIYTFITTPKYATLKNLTEELVKAYDNKYMTISKPTIEDNIYLHTHDSMYTHDSTSISDDKICVWFSKDLVVFNEKDSLYIEYQYIKVNYIFEYNTYLINIKNFTIASKSDIKKSYPLKRIIKKSFMCKSCSFYNKPQYDIDDICTLCETKQTH